MTDPVEARLRDALSRPAGPSSDFDLNPASVPRRQALAPGRGPGAGLAAARRRGPDPDQALLAFEAPSRPDRLSRRQGRRIGRQAPKPPPCAKAQEEIGLDPSSVTILGTLPVHETVTGFSRHPLRRRDPRPVRADPRGRRGRRGLHRPPVPCPHPARYAIERRRWMGVWRRYYAVPYGPYYIWGATARILRGLAERAGP
jgi:hypothetical protein